MSKYEGWSWRKLREAKVPKREWPFKAVEAFAAFNGAFSPGIRVIPHRVLSVTTSGGAGGSRHLGHK